MHVSTKQRILEAAIHLFNQNGVANVRLQHIADEASISVGNLAYHFKNKEAIVTSVYETLFEEFAQLLSGYLSSPSLMEFDMQLSQYHQFFTRYQFYLIDLFEVERSYPAIMESWHQMVGKMLIQIRKRIDFHVQRGVLIPEPMQGMYDSLTNSIWMAMMFWIPQQILKGQPMEEALFKSAVWAQISPYLSPVGRQEFSRDIQAVR